eukprot:508406-Prorocentrum_minimum.AAC.5
MGPVTHEKSSVPIMLDIWSSLNSPMSLSPHQRHGFCGVREAGVQVTDLRLPDVVEQGVLHLRWEQREVGILIFAQAVHQKAEGVRHATVARVYDSFAHLLARHTVAHRLY